LQVGGQAEVAVAGVADALGSLNFEEPWSLQGQVSVIVGFVNAALVKIMAAHVHILGGLRFSYQRVLWVRELPVVQDLPLEPQRTGIGQIVADHLQLAGSPHSHVCCHVPADVHVLPPKRWESLVSLLLSSCKWSAIAQHHEITN
jgi:hypothetical protein